ncbi:hypothetical protein LOY38_20455 [Pseudomonas sp. B21-015]|uniref:hypothetical protein n=1 Tax=Pseudomonas sp. B21-015 TaxID=2895473 RepID=UPI0021607D3A|nr:hypothetical protein [Pseudomonas sp. B21-015]UVM48731.1 hypothetical protein LOY38_20455 [Pseudomonas sp. B21-015]
MIRSKLTALTVVGLLSISSLAAFAQSTGRDAPVDKGGMPPYSEMNAGTSDGKALPPDTIGGGNGGEANGSSTSPEEGSGSMNGGSSMGSGSGSGSGESGGSGVSGGRADKTGNSGG